MVDDLREATEAIIDLNPSLITLKRTLKHKDEYDNEIIDGIVTIPEQRMRIAEVSHNETEKLMEQGLVPSHVVNVTALYDADVMNGDRFVHNGLNYEIVFVRPYTVNGDERYKYSGKAKEITEAV